MEEFDLVGLKEKIENERISTELKEEIFKVLSHKIKTEVHHTIPISMEWENIAENKIKMTSEKHNQLHKSQNIDYRELRKYREKTNGILVPNDFAFAMKRDLRKSFFENVVVAVDEQLWSLNQQAKRYGKINNVVVENENSFDLAVELLIEQQKIVVKNILEGKT